MKTNEGLKIKRILRNRNQPNTQEIRYCCLEGENLFHDNIELEHFTNDINSSPVNIEEN